MDFLDTALDTANKIFDLKRLQAANDRWKQVTKPIA